MENAGFIKIHRKILEWEWYGDLPTRTLFFHLLLKANYKNSKYKGFDIPAGSAVTGLNALAEQTGLTRSQVRTAMKKLEQSRTVTLKKTNKFTVISISNWNDYQTDRTQIALKSHSNRTQIAPSKEGKKVRRKEKNIYMFEDFWKIFPNQRKGNKQKAQAAYKRALTRDSEDAIHAGLQAYIASEEVKAGFAKGAEAWLNDDRWRVDYSRKGNERVKQDYGDTIREAGARAIENLKRMENENFR